MFFLFTRLWAVWQYNLAGLALLLLVVVGLWFVNWLIVRVIDDIVCVKQRQIRRIALSAMDQLAERAVFSAAIVGCFVGNQGALVFKPNARLTKRKNNGALGIDSV